MKRINKKKGLYGMQTNVSNQRMCGPYSICDIPKCDIDYRGLVAYAHSKGKKVVELSDEEKNLFVKGSNMDEVRRRSIKL